MEEDNELDFSGEPEQHREVLLKLSNELWDTYTEKYRQYVNLSNGTGTEQPPYMFDTGPSYTNAKEKAAYYKGQSDAFAYAAYVVGYFKAMCKGK